MKGMDANNGLNGMPVDIYRWTPKGLAGVGATTGAGAARSEAMAVHSLALAHFLSA